jgi:hypothetical protein
MGTPSSCPLEGERRVTRIVGLYCERVGPGLWAEPLNASSNVAFFLAVWVIWNLARRAHALSPGISLLLVVLVTVGIGSSLFHTFATAWARVLDLAPILLFQLSYLWLYSREIVKMRFGYAAGLLAAFLVALFYGRQFSHILNGSLVYAPAFLLSLGLGRYHYRTHKIERYALFAAAGVFLVAVVFRSVDQAVCPFFPVGTHFLWHLLMPVVLYLSMRGLLLNWAKTGR